MEAKDIKTVTAYRIITDEPVAVIVGFTPDNLNDFEYDEFECTDTTEGKGGPDDTVFIMTTDKFTMTIMSGSSTGMWLINPDGSLGERLWAEPDLEVIRHPDQWTAFARMIEGENEIVLRAFHVSTTIATGEHINGDNVEEFIHDAMEDIVEKFGASATNSVIAEIGKVSVQHNQESEEDSVWAHVDTIVNDMDKLLAKDGWKAIDRKSRDCVEDIRVLLAQGIESDLSFAECTALLDEIKVTMEAHGHKIDGGD